MRWFLNLGRKRSKSDERKFILTKPLDVQTPCISCIHSIPLIRNKERILSAYYIETGGQDHSNQSCCCYLVSTDDETESQCVVIHPVHRDGSGRVLFTVRIYDTIQFKYTHTHTHMYCILVFEPMDTLHGMWLPQK